jgi:hypothetical protein
MGRLDGDMIHPARRAKYGWQEEGAEIMPGRNSIE